MTTSDEASAPSEGAEDGVHDALLNFQRASQELVTALTHAMQNATTEASIQLRHALDKWRTRVGEAFSDRKSDADE